MLGHSYSQTANWILQREQGLLGFSIKLNWKDFPDDKHNKTSWIKHLCPFTTSVSWSIFLVPKYQFAHCSIINWTSFLWAYVDFFLASPMVVNLRWFYYIDYSIISSILTSLWSYKK